MNAQDEMDIIAGIGEDVECIRATQALAPMAAAALERIRQRLQQLGVQATTRLIEESQ